MAVGPEKRLLPLLSGLLLILTSCDTSDGTAPEIPVALGDAVAFSLWTPGPQDSCSRAIHDSYSAVGPDGLRYPTWHPPVDPGTGHVRPRTRTRPVRFVHLQRGRADPVRVREPAPDGRWIRRRPS